MNELSTEQLDNFIVFEGMDGSGQDTQAELLADALVARGYKVVLTYEPSKQAGILGTTIRDILKNRKDMPVKSLQLLILADRVLHVDQVREMIADGCVVISVRYMYSNIVYGQAGGISKDWMVGANADFPRPKLAIYLDLPVATAMDRVQKRSQHLDIFENTDYLTKVSAHYQELMGDCPEMVAVDASQPIEEVHRQVIERLDAKNLWPQVAIGVDSGGRCL